MTIRTENFVFNRYKAARLNANKAIMKRLEFKIGVKNSIAVITNIPATPAETPSKKACKGLCFNILSKYLWPSKVNKKAGKNIAMVINNPPLNPFAM